MTNQQHSITPPPELMQQWAAEYWNDPGEPIGNGERYIATQAAQWGADQELEACVEWLGYAPVVYNDNGDLHPGSYLRDNRRPKPPSLKEQALALLDKAEALLDKAEDPSWDINDFSIIRQALEALSND
jgi:hypothetical protein